MAKISFNSNIASLQAQRRLTENSKELGKTNERLSSGLRITRASDDAAGIAIASSLNVDGRVFTQAIRNLNDGIALLNVAEGGLTGLRDIVFRLRELAEQAANGVLTSVQRQSIDGEGQALISEYNRIISVAEFNGLKLLDGTLTNLTLQAGYGTRDVLTVSIGQQLQRNLGQSTITAAGTLQAVVSYSSGSGSGTISTAIGDVNGDGKQDVITAEESPEQVSVFLGNGDGTFQARLSYNVGTNPNTADLGDVNGDGKLDIVTADRSVSKVSVLFGNGNGTFQARTSYSVPGISRTAILSDVNADGKLDILATDGAAGQIAVYLNNGNGTFQASVGYSTASTHFAPATTADVNADGKIDIVVGCNSLNKVCVLLGNGNGTFQARISFSSGSTPWSVALSDINGDGYLDIASADSGDDKISIFFGNGNGSFTARTSFSSGDSPTSAALADLDQDGRLDIVTTGLSDAEVSVLLGNGNGSFKARTSYATGTSPWRLAVGDINADGVVDVAVASVGTGKLNILLGNTTITTTAISFLTQSSSLAALTTLASVQTSIENELANIGANQSRLATAISHLQQTRENYNAAESRIVDVDVALESAELVKRQILQDTSSAILAQANQEPELLLRLLEP